MHRTWTGNSLDLKKKTWSEKFDLHEPIFPIIKQILLTLNYDFRCQAYGKHSEFPLAYIFSLVLIQLCLFLSLFILIIYSTSNYPSPLAHSPCLKHQQIKIKICECQT